MIHEVIRRASMIRPLNWLAVAIPQGSDSSMLMNHIADYLHNGGLPAELKTMIVRGSENDVISRFGQAAEATDADHIVRITSDCPCLDPELSSRVLQHHLDGGYDFTSNVFPERTYPMGYDTEVFTREALEKSLSLSSGAHREHVTSLLYNEERWKVGSIRQDKNEGCERLTLDTIDDYIKICEYMSNETCGCI